MIQTSYEFPFKLEQHTPCPDLSSEILNEGLSLFRELLGEAYALTNTDPGVPENQYCPNYINAVAKLQNALTVLKLVLRK